MKTLTPLFSIFSILFVFTILYLSHAQLLPGDKLDFRSYELIDKVLLIESPIRQLFCLHSQPPVFNALVALAIQLDKIVPIEYPTILRTFYYVIGSAGGLAFIYLLSGLGLGRLTAIVVTAATYTLPGTLKHFGALTYTFITFSLINIALAFAHRHLDTKSFRSLIFAGLALLGIALTRTLFPPFFCALFFLLLIFFSAKKMSFSMKQKIIILFFLPVFFVWQIKNGFIYGKFTNSSWTTYNLQRSTPIGKNNAMYRYIGTGKVSDIAKRTRDKYLAPCKDAQVINQIVKSNGERNWHHFMFLESGEKIRQLTIKWRLKHMNAWAQRTLAFYFIGTSPTFVHPYTGAVWFRENTFLYEYGSMIQKVIFYDLRPVITNLLGDPQLPEWFKLKYGKPVPFSLFGVLIFPFVIICTLIKNLKSGSDLSADRPVRLLAIFIIVWNILVPALTDGAEGNRMRFCTSGLFIYLLLQLILSLPCIAKRRQNRL